MCSSLSHSAPQLQVEPKTGIVSMPCCKGYCSSKASHGVESGSWYFEVEIIKGSVRIGWSQALAEIQAPVGYDEYGYGISNKQSKIFHCSRGYSVDMDLSQVGRIGCLLRISDDMELDTGIAREQIEKKYPPLNFLTTYNVKQEILKSGEIKFYADGKELSSEKFENIYRAKYFPTVSIFGDAVVKVVFKENEFKFEVPEGASAFDFVK